MQIQTDRFTLNINVICPFSQSDALSADQYFDGAYKGLFYVNDRPAFGYYHLKQFSDFLELLMSLCHEIICFFNLEKFMFSNHKILPLICAEFTRLVFVFILVVQHWILLNRNSVHCASTILTRTQTKNSNKMSPLLTVHVSFFLSFFSLLQLF